MVRSKLLQKFKDLDHFFSATREEIYRNYSLYRERFALMQQVHGSDIVLAKNRFSSCYLNCDGLLTQSKSLLIVRTADCMPVFLFDKNKNIAVALHVGWKGLFSGIIENALKMLKDLDGCPEDIFVGIGPHIKRCCYKVDYGRFSAFKEKFGQSAARPVVENGEWYLDLEGVLSKILFENNIKKENIEFLQYCTFCDKRFYSFRRDGKDAKRMFNGIAIL